MIVLQANALEENHVFCRSIQRFSSAPLGAGVFVNASRHRAAGLIHPCTSVANKSIASLVEAQDSDSIYKQALSPIFHLENFDLVL